MLSIAVKDRVMIFANTLQEVWDIKWDLQNCALDVDRGAEITSTGVTVKGYKPIVVTACTGEKMTVTGAVLVTDKEIANRLQSYLGNPIKAHLLPVEGVS